MYSLPFEENMWKSKLRKVCDMKRLVAWVKNWKNTNLLMWKNKLGVVRYKNWREHFCFINLVRLTICPAAFNIWVVMRSHLWDFDETLARCTICFKLNAKMKDKYNYVPKLFHYSLWGFWILKTKDFFYSYRQIHV